MSALEAPLLSRWFKIMDSDAPEEILKLISEDFRFSVSSSGRCAAVMSSRPHSWLRRGWTPKAGCAG